jgi:hypothetical protein
VTGEFLAARGSREHLEVMALGTGAYVRVQFDPGGQRLLRIELR